jgi:hypothetical protein
MGIQILSLDCLSQRLGEAGRSQRATHRIDRRTLPGEATEAFLNTAIFQRVKRNDRQTPAGRKNFRQRPQRLV